MTFDSTMRKLKFLAQQGKYVYNTSDLHTLLRAGSLQAARATIARLVQRGILVSACRGVHVFKEGIRSDQRVLQDVAITLRRGTHCYVTMESALIMHGEINDCPDALHVATTGRRGIYTTPWGRIEFTQTRRSPVEIIGRAEVRSNGGLRVAASDMAWEDLGRFRRLSGRANACIAGLP
jgi:hypothetical protein